MTTVEVASWQGCVEDHALGLLPGSRVLSEDFDQRVKAVVIQ
jgi:hypothetical protein